MNREVDRPAMEIVLHGVLRPRVNHEYTQRDGFCEALEACYRRFH
jgi:hypothetical protein